MSVLAGRRALVIGGSSGLGLATTRLLARDGAHVTIAGRSADRLASAASELAADGLHVATVVCDVMVGSSVAAAVTAAADAEGNLDAAVVVPGGGSIGPVLLREDDEFAAEVASNVNPAFFTIKYAGWAMLRRGGSIVAVSSTAAVFSTRYLASYAAGKAAVDQLVRVAADELGQYNIRVNAVRPGLTRTGTTEAMFASDAMLDVFLAEQPLARGGEAPDIGQAIRYLAGPESSWVTGQHITVDGGHTLRKFIDYSQLMPIPDVRDAVLGTQQ